MRKHKGFTLVELLVASTILIIVLSIVIASYKTGFTAFSHNSVQKELLQNGRVIINRLSREIRQTGGIFLTPDSPNLTSCLSSAGYLPAELLFENTPSEQTEYIVYTELNSDPSILYRLKVQFYFWHNPSDLVFWNAVDSDGNLPDANIVDAQIAGEYINELSFSDGIEPKLITIDLKLAKDDQDVNLITKVGGRNVK